MKRKEMLKITQSGWTIVCVFVFIFPLFFFMTQRGIALEAQEVISSHDLTLSKVPILLHAVDEEKSINELKKMIPAEVKPHWDNPDDIAMLVRAISTAPGFFASLERLRNIFVQKAVEATGTSEAIAKKTADLMITNATVEELKEALITAVRNDELKDQFSPNRIIIEKNDERTTYSFCDLSEDNLTKDEVRDVLGNVKLPKDVLFLEGVNQKEMISPVALTDKGKTVLIKSGVNSSEIKPIMFLRPIKRAAIAHAARRHMKMKTQEVQNLKLNNKKIAFYNFTHQKGMKDKVQELLQGLDVPGSVRQVEGVPAKRLPGATVYLVDAGATILVPSHVMAREPLSVSLEVPVTRGDLAREAAKVERGFTLNEQLLTIPAMISGLDVREIYQSLVEQFLSDQHSFDFVNNAEAISVAIIRSTAQPARYISLREFQKGLMDEGLPEKLAQEASTPAVIHAVASIVYEVRKRVLEMSGQKVVVYIDNREIPLLTVGTNANYTPRQISLVQERLLKEREILSQVDEIIVVDNMDKTIGYTFVKEGKLKAYVSGLVFREDIFMPAIEWMPTLGAEAHISQMETPNTVISTMRPRFKWVLVNEKSIKKAYEKMREVGGYKVFSYTEQQGFSEWTAEGHKQSARLRSVFPIKHDSKIMVLIPEAELTRIDEALVVWSFGERFMKEVRSFQGKGRFVAEADKMEYDFTAIASDYIENVHRPIIEQNMMILKDDLIKKENVFIDGVRVIPSDQFSIGRMDTRLRKMPADRKHRDSLIDSKVVLEMGEDLAVALIHGDISLGHLKRILKGGKIRLAPEDQRKWDRQRKLYQTKIDEGSKINLFGSDTVNEASSRRERMFIAGLNKAFKNGTGWIEKQIEGEKTYKDYKVYETLDTTFEDIFDPQDATAGGSGIKLSAILTVYHEMQAKNSLIFKNE